MLLILLPLEDLELQPQQWLLRRGWEWRTSSWMLDMSIWVEIWEYSAWVLASKIAERIEVVSFKSALEGGNLALLCLFFTLTYGRVYFSNWQFINLQGYQHSRVTTCMMQLTENVFEVQTPTVFMPRELRLWASNQGTNLALLCLFFPLIWQGVFLKLAVHQHSMLTCMMQLTEIVFEDGADTNSIHAMLEYYLFSQCLCDLQLNSHCVVTSILQTGFKVCLILFDTWYLWTRGDHHAAGCDGMSFLAKNPIFSLVKKDVESELAFETD